MLLNCSSCNTKYLINSADLKPDGRTVECGNCSYQWFEKPRIIEKNDFNYSSVNILNMSTTNDYKKTLPSTYIENTETSIVNSILMIIFIILVIILYLVITNLDIGILYFIKYYLGEFVVNIFNMIKNLAMVVYQTFN